MTDTPLEEIVADLERSRVLGADDARAVLENASMRLDGLEDDPTVDDDRRTELERRIDQRLRAIRNRDAYDGERLGSSMNPTDEDAP